MIDQLSSKSNKERLLKIVYLFLSSENRISDAEFSLFEETGKSIEGFSEIKGGVIGECEKILAPPDNNKSRFEIVAEYFSKPKESMGFFSVESNTGNNIILWTLIKLLFQIEMKTEKKQQLVEFWAEAKTINKSIMLEMIDTCETERAISDFKNSIETDKNMSYQEGKPIIHELDENMVSLEESVNNLIVLG